MGEKGEMEGGGGLTGESRLIVHLRLGSDGSFWFQLRETKRQQEEFFFLGLISQQQTSEVVPLGFEKFSCHTVTSCFQQTETGGAVECVNCSPGRTLLHCVVFFTSWDNLMVFFSGLFDSLAFRLQLSYFHSLC